ncbi:MAG: glycosyltransferase [Verrucomicrobiae bacterium]|nr:glycosyltransferase [Verrucomicrobiae bacterium]
MVNICMVTYNRLEFTRQAVASIQRHTHCPFILTVVDNGSSDGTGDWLRERQRQGVIKNLRLLDKNVGVAKAANLGWVQEPQAEYYVKFDNDIVIQKDGWLERMIEVIEAVPMLGMIGYNFEPVTVPLSKINGCRIRVKIANLGGACVLIPARTQQWLGYWREDYGFYGEEDADYGFRVALAGLWSAYMEDEWIGIHLPNGRAANIDLNSAVADLEGQTPAARKYRQWKDAQRQINTAPAGPFETNVKGYLSGKKSLYAPTSWHPEQAEKKPPPKTGAMPAEEGKDGRFEKMRLNVGFFPYCPDACALYRVILPAHAMQGGERFSVDIVARPEETYSKLSSADIIIIQRALNRAFLTSIPYWQACGKVVGYELDDNLHEIPKTNVNSTRGHLRAYMDDIMRVCDFHVFSTEPLRDYYGKLLGLRAENSFVIPNAVALKAYQNAAAGKVDGKVRIGFVGSSTHMEDVGAFFQPVRKAIQESGDRVTFVLMGWTREDVKSCPQFEGMDVEAHEEVPIMKFADNLVSLGLDIAIAPLLNNEFNRCKSAIKILEYGAARCAVVASDIEPYRLIGNGAHGFLASTEEQWYQAVKSLIENPALRREMADNLHRLVAEKYEISAVRSQWLQMLEAVRSRFANRFERSPRLLSCESLNP